MNSAQNGWKYPLLLLGLGFLVMMVIEFNSRTAELHRLNSERDIVAAQVTSAVQTQMAIKADIAYATSEPAVLNWAYGDGHMARPGDQVVIPIPGSKSTPTPQPAPMVVATQVTNLDRWIALFAGPQVP